MSLSARVNALATQIASSIKLRGIPAGGTTGQVLRKTSASDYAVGWGRQAVSYASRSVASDQTLQANSVQPLTLSTVNADTDGYTSNTSGANAFVIPANAAGVYRVSLNFAVTANTAGGAAFLIRVNGTDTLELRIAAPVANVGTYTGSRTVFLNLAANAVLSVYYFANQQNFAVVGGNRYGSFELERMA